MRKILFQDASDSNCTYPYINVYYQEDSDTLINPFMEIAITEEKQLEFRIFGQPYASKFDVVLTVDQWKKILSIAEEHLPRALANEDEFQKWHHDEDAT